MKEQRNQKKGNAGIISKELGEIKKLQKNSDSYWSMWTNTCADLYTILCC